MSVDGSVMPCATVDQYECEIERNIVAWRLHDQARRTKCCGVLHAILQICMHGRLTPSHEAHALASVTQTTPLVDSGAHAESPPTQHHAAQVCVVPLGGSKGAAWRVSMHMECVGSFTCIGPRATTKLFNRHGNAGDGAHERSIAQRGATHHCWR